MKKSVILFVSFLMIAALGVAQRYAYVNTEYILNSIPAYDAAQRQLDQLSVEWQKEIETLFAEVDKMYKEYQSESVLLTEELKIKREEAIIQKEKEAKDMQKKYFGKEGELYKKREELVKPLQDEIFNAIKEIAIEGNYAVIFDSASGAMMLYTDPKYDKSDDVLEKLGYKN